MELPFQKPDFEFLCLALNPVSELRCLSIVPSSVALSFPL